MDLTHRWPVGFAVAGPVPGWMIQGMCNVVKRSLALVSLTVCPKPVTTADVMMEVVFGPTPPPGRLLSEPFRKISLLELERIAHETLERQAQADEDDRALLAQMQSEFDLAPLGAYSNDAAEILKLAPTYGVKRGRKGYGDEFYRWVARTYLRLSGTEGKIFDQIADAALKEGLVDFHPSDLTAKKWAWEARRRQFLGAATRGRRSTTPGERLDDDLTEPSEG